MLTKSLNQNVVKLDSMVLLMDGNGDSENRVVSVGDFLTIGRDQQNHLVLDDQYISGRHARIEKRNDGYLLRDLQSLNGTFVNGNKVGEIYLSPHDEVVFGKIKFVFMSQEMIEVTTSPLSLKSKNQEWQKSLDQIPLLAQATLPLMILGPSGSGKEVIARLIHQASFARGPFISVNCSALNESLVESELFGHIKGSFTGAIADRKGAFEVARNGSLFLDEIGDLPLSLQPKLLRALDNKEIRPVGSDKCINTEVRILCATHKDIYQLIDEEKFREDLYYRLHGSCINVPSLCERMEDFEGLLYYFARKNRVRFSFGAIAALKNHLWPGNVRELKNLVSRAAVFYKGTSVLEEHIQTLLERPRSKFHNYHSNTNTNPYLNNKISNVMSNFGKSAGTFPLIKEVEKDMIMRRLILNQGNQRKTAADLGMPKSTLNDRIKTYGIDIKQLLQERCVYT